MDEAIMVIDPTIGQLNSMTKKQLIGFIATQSESTSQLIDRLDDKCRDIEVLVAKLTLAESYVEQGRAMIDGVMERWNEYDV